MLPTQDRPEFGGKDRRFGKNEDQDDEDQERVGADGQNASQGIPGKSNHLGRSYDVRCEVCGDRCCPRNLRPLQPFDPTVPQGGDAGLIQEQLALEVVHGLSREEDEQAENRYIHQDCEEDGQAPGNSVPLEPNNDRKGQDRKEQGNGKRNKDRLGIPKPPDHDHHKGQDEKEPSPRVLLHSVQYHGFPFWPPIRWKRLAFSAEKYLRLEKITESDDPLPYRFPAVLPSFYTTEADPFSVMTDDACPRRTFPCSRLR